MYNKISIIKNEFIDYWTRTFTGFDFHSYTNGDLECDVVDINDSQLLIVCKAEILDELQNLLETLILDYELYQDLALTVTNDYNNLLFTYERAILIEDVTE